MRIGILGGTGPQGRGLARRFATAGHAVVLGSRSAERAHEVAAAYADLGDVTGDTNAGAAAAELVVVTVPYEGHAALLAELAGPLAGKIVVDCVNPLGFDGQGPYALAVEAGSAAQEAQQLLPGSTVVAAFHHVSAVLLDDPAVDHLEGDVLVLGEDRDAVATVCELATAIPGARGIYAGRLRLAGQVEAFTANLIAINRRYKAHAGLHVTDLP
ncbi:NADPH-dependent F420 reductase [Microlunatus capsulatus]|uniref:NADPH-dependent F420 reductase n=1 Tax=Microlunatus capsulatus TaxID=99117 RepID=A0ABS4Z942_9ACTN|nr:NADPH-dependent F420 reductase [Microlunatus capsulatus]MBP2417563.1 NADPH-dependent F420 reductase [Microlunatus capsulatus]